jgi:hypothetical protein
VHTGFLLGRSEEEDNMKDTSLDGIIILEQTLKNMDRGTWSELNWLRIGTVVLLL